MHTFIKKKWFFVIIFVVVMISSVFLFGNRIQQRVVSVQQSSTFTIEVQTDHHDVLQQTERYVIPIERRLKTMFGVYDSQIDVTNERVHISVTPTIQSFSRLISWHVQKELRNIEELKGMSIVEVKQKEESLPYTLLFQTKLNDRKELLDYITKNIRPALFEIQGVQQVRIGSVEHTYSEARVLLDALVEKNLLFEDVVQSVRRAYEPNETVTYYNWGGFVNEAELNRNLEDVVVTNVQLDDRNLQDVMDALQQTLQSWNETLESTSSSAKELTTIQRSIQGQLTLFERLSALQKRINEAQQDLTTTITATSKAALTEQMNQDLQETSSILFMLQQLSEQLDNDIANAETTLPSEFQPIVQQSSQTQLLTQKKLQIVKLTDIASVTTIPKYDEWVRIDGKDVIPLYVYPASKVAPTSLAIQIESKLKELNIPPFYEVKYDGYEQHQNVKMLQTWFKYALYTVGILILIDFVFTRKWHVLVHMITVPLYVFTILFLLVIFQIPLDVVTVTSGLFGLGMLFWHTRSVFFRLQNGEAIHVGDVEKTEWRFAFLVIFIMLVFVMIVKNIPFQFVYEWNRLFFFLPFSMLVGAGISIVTATLLCSVVPLRKKQNRRLVEKWIKFAFGFKKSIVAFTLMIVGLSVFVLFHEPQFQYDFAQERVKPVVHVKWEQERSIEEKIEITKELELFLEKEKKIEREKSMITSDELRIPLQWMKRKQVQSLQEQVQFFIPDESVRIETSSFVTKQSDVVFTLIGKDVAVVREAAEQMKQQLQQYASVTEVTTSGEETVERPVITVNEEKAFASGITKEEIQRQLQYYEEGVTIERKNKNQTKNSVHVQLRGDGVENATLRTVGNEEVALTDIATIDQQQREVSVQRNNQQFVLRLYVDAERMKKEEWKEVQKLASETVTTYDVKIKMKSEEYGAKQQWIETGVTIAMIALAMMVVLAVVWRSVMLPLFTSFAIVGGIVGVILATYATRQTFVSEALPFYFALVIIIILQTIHLLFQLRFYNFKESTTIEGTMGTFLSKEFTSNLFLGLSLLVLCVAFMLPLRPFIPLVDLFVPGIVGWIGAQWMLYTVFPIFYVMYIRIKHAFQKINLDYDKDFFAD